MNHIFLARLPRRFLRLSRVFGILLLCLCALPSRAEFRYQANSGSVVITGYTGSETTLVIPDTIDNLPVTSIGEGAFRGLRGLTSVTIPGSVTSIGNSAFLECSGLTSVTVEPQNAAYSSLAGVLLSKDQTVLIAFPAAKKGSYTIPESVTSIGRSAFWGCSGLTSVIIPNSVITIGYSAFQFCSGLTSVTISNSVTSIGSNAFCRCSGLTSIIIPNSVTSIGYNAVWGCTGLKSVTVGSQNTVYSSLEGVLLNKDQTNLIVFPAGKNGSYTIPNSVTSIGDSAFFGCSGLTGINIPNAVTSIGRSAFWGCSGLASVTVEPQNTAFSSPAGVLLNKDQTNIIAFPAAKKGPYTIPSSVTSIADGQFQNCSGLTSVSIPGSVTSIGDGALEGCTGLTNVTVEPQNIAYSSLEGVLLNKDQTNIIVFPAGKKGSYTIPSSVTSIGDRLLQYCTGLTSVTISSGVTSIGDWAFWGCSGLSSVTIPNSVTKIGDNAFRDCSGLTSITVEPQNIAYSSIEGVLLNKDQTNLIAYPATKNGSYTIPNSVIRIGDRAFWGCSGLLSVTIPNSVTSISNNAFSYCSGLTSITVAPQNAAYSSIEGVLLNKEQTNLILFPAAKGGSFTIPSSVTSIGNNAFWGCRGLTNVTVAPQNAAYSSIEGVLLNKEQTNLILFPAAKGGLYTIPNGVTSIGDNAFAGCSGLTSLTIPSSVTSIGDNAFSACRGLTSVTVEPQSIAYSSVEGVLLDKDQTNLIVFPANKRGAYTIPNSVTSIGDTAFLGCSGLTGINVEPGNTTYSSIEGVLLNKEQTSLIVVPAGKNGSCNIPSSVTSIGDYAFFGCSGLTGINVEPENTAYSSIEGVLLNKDQTSLIVFPAGKNGSCTIPSSVTSIGNNAFWGCRGLTNVTVAPQNAAYSSIEGVLLNKEQTNLIVFPAAKGGSYTIPNGVTSIGDNAFAGCSGLTSLTIPSSVTSIGYNAFAGCSGLTSLTIPSSVTSIGYNALTLCTNLKSLVFEGNAPVLRNQVTVRTVRIRLPSPVPAVPVQQAAVPTERVTSAPVAQMTLTLVSPTPGQPLFSSPTPTVAAQLAPVPEGAAAAAPAPAVQFPLGSPGSPDFKVYYFADKTGFTSPQWAGCPLVCVPVAKGLYLLSGPSDTTVLTGSAPVQSIRVDNFGNGGPSSATYALLSVSGNVSTTGIVPDGGQLNLPLRSLSTSGYYTARITRTYADGTALSVDSSAFYVDLKSWAECAGVYEMLLADVNGLIGDGAHYRGKLVATITKTGAVSGRIFYNEAPHLSAVDPAQSPAWSMRAYTPVTRTFAARFTTDNLPLATCTPRIGVGVAASRQALTLSLDFSTTPAQLTAEVEDYISLPSDSSHPEGSVCSGSATASVINLRAVPVAGIPQPANLSAVTASLYAIGSNRPQNGQTPPSADNNAYILIQALPSGRLIWTTRMTGYTGSGSGYLRLSDPAASNCLEVPFYESRSLSNPLQLNATSLLGELRLDKDDTTDDWSVRLQNGTTEDSLEKQSSYISKGLLKGKLSPVYSPIAFNQDKAAPSVFTKNFNWSGATNLDFSAENATAWSPTTGVFGLQPSLTKAPLYLNAHDPLTGENYTWSLSVSPTGLVRAAKHLPGDSSQPALTMRLDRARGEWTGSYVSPSKVRRNLFGVVIRFGGGEDPCSQGWIEAGGLPGVRTGAWSLAQ